MKRIRRGPAGCASDIWKAVMMSQQSGSRHRLSEPMTNQTRTVEREPRAHARVNIEADGAGNVVLITGQDAGLASEWKRAYGGKHLGALEHKTDVDSPALWDRLRTGHSEEFSASLDDRVWTVCLFPVLSADGRLERVFGFAQSEADSPKASEEDVLRFSPLALTSPDLIAILTEDCHIRQIGLSSADVLGAASDRLVGADWLSLIHPNEASVFAAGLKLCVANPSRPLLMEIRLRHADGRWRSFKARAENMQRDDAVRCIAVECTAVVRNEEGGETQARDQRLLQGLLATTSDAVCVVDKTQRILLVNPCFRRLFAPGDAIVNGAPLGSVLRFQGFELFISQAFREGYLFDVEAQDIVAGQRRAFAFNFVRLNGADSDAAEILVCARDLTQERVAQQQIMQAAHFAAIGELTAGITHELNDALAQITDGVGALLEAEAHPAARDRARQVHQHAEQASRALSRVISFVRTVKTTKVPVNVAHEVRKVLDLRGYELRASKIDVIVNLPASLPAVLADRAQVAQVFLNLIVNAEQAMMAAHTERRIWVTGHVSGAFVRLSFKDSGPGIREEHLGRIFEPFFTTKEPAAGTGLGLSVSHRIVTDHGGRMYAVSDPGKGATFVVELPVTEAADMPPLH